VTPDTHHLAWRKSSHSGGSGGNCVEVAPASAGTIAVRDSKHPGGPVLMISSDAWTAFTSRIKASEFAEG
jgi:hypothetical protein